MTLHLPRLNEHIKEASNTACKVTIQFYGKIPKLVKFNPLPSMFVARNKFLPIFFHFWFKLYHNIVLLLFYHLAARPQRISPNFSFLNEWPPW